MRVALAQINTKVGDITGNTAKIKDYIELAKKKNADVVLFSELVITGYPPKDLLDYDVFIDDNIKALDDIKNGVTGITVILGYIDKNPDITGKKYFNSAAVIENKEIVATYNKALLPTYDVFDETRYFESGKDSCVVNINGKKIGLTICEDIWNDKSYFDKPAYEVNPVERLAKQGVDVIFNLSASPYNLNKEKVRRAIIRNIATTYGVEFVYVNEIGSNDDLVFDGTSFAVDSKGNIVAQCLDFEEDLVIYDDETKIGDIRELSNTEEASLFKALKRGLQDYCSKVGFKKVLIGLSGGIDSALTAAIAVEALGSENVTGITMPSMYSSQGSIDDSLDIAEKLGIECKIVPIKPIFECFSNGLNTENETVVTGLAEENLQARIRGNVLMTYSNRYGYLLLSTGNKSEISVGYCTLYGDMAGGFNFLSDVPKTMVYKLSRYINRDREIIPYSTIEKPPSAELKPDQKDQDSLPPYEVLDDILKMYVEEYKSSDEIAKKYDRQLVLDIIKKINMNEYKRKQLTLGLKVTTRAFGSGRRFPIVQGYKFQ